MTTFCLQTHCARLESIASYIIPTVEHELEIKLASGASARVSLIETIKIPLSSVPCSTTGRVDKWRQLDAESIKIKIELNPHSCYNFGALFLCEREGGYISSLLRHVVVPMHDVVTYPIEILVSIISQIVLKRQQSSNTLLSTNNACLLQTRSTPIHAPAHICDHV